jgi:small subunit ribosomal protein S9
MHHRDHPTRVLATGRRKASSARVFLSPATSIFESSIKINKKLLTEWTTRDSDRWEILKPFMATKTMGRFNVVSTVKGGGTTGQTGALRHGIARALELTNPALRPALKKEGLLTRDSRVVERKKFGRHKARKGFQWVKR